jgi:hypothetical protein
VTSASGQPPAGTVDIEFVFGGQVAGRDTPPTYPVTIERWHDTLKFPAAAAGMPLTFQAVVHTRLGSITARLAHHRSFVSGAVGHAGAKAAANEVRVTRQTG